MRKLILSLIVLITGCNLALAQAYEGMVEYNKKKQDAFLIDYSYSPEAVENAITRKMEQLGYKPKEEKGIFNKDKGFKIFKGAFVTEAHADRMDYIIKVEPKSRKNKDESVVSLIMLKEGANAKSGFAVMDVDRVKDFLRNLRPEIEAADLEIQIRNQEETLAKAEKKLSTLKSEKAELEKKLADNESNQEATQKDIDNQRVTLEVLRGKRKRE